MKKIDNINDNKINNSCGEEKKIDININVIKEFDESDKKNNSKINENKKYNYNGNIDLKSIDKLDKNKKEQKNEFKDKN